MKRNLIHMVLWSVLILMVGFFLGETSSATAAPDAYFDLPLCLPGMPDDGACLMAGPALKVQELKAAGFSFPFRDLPAASPPAALNEMPVFIGKINLPEAEPAPIYASFEDAIAGENPINQIAPGTLRYVSYFDRREHNGKAYLQLVTGGWMRAAPTAVTNFQGLKFYTNARNDFGWIVDQTGTYIAPSFAASPGDGYYYREDIIQVYNTEVADGVTWYQIAPDQWVNSMKARVVFVNYAPPDTVETDRYIEINLEQQTLAVYEAGQLQFATIIASGLEPFYTQPGVFKIYQKLPLETMQGAFEADRSDFYYLQDVPWTMYFDQARALHAAYWRTYFGYPQSHGCVNLSPGDANWLYQWAEEGDIVWVHDPSGRTPTDEDYYGPGAP
jgi:hypothetical protein